MNEERSKKTKIEGKLYGVGVGPGDPELLTLKAVRVIESSDVIIVPGTDPEQTIAWGIVSAARLKTEDKELIGIEMPMTKDERRLRDSQRAGAAKICEYLERGLQVAFLTIGDPTIYSTYLYLHHLVEQQGYEVEIVNGIPSFCAAAARLNIGLTEKEEQLHLIPASYEVEQALALPGTKILMKAGKKLSGVVQQIRANEQSAMAVENCGMPQEHIYRNIDEIPEQTGYLMLTIVKDKGEN